MKFLLIILLFAFTSFKLTSKLNYDDRKQLKLISSFVVLNDGQIFLTTRDSKLYKAESLNDNFKLIIYDSTNNDKNHFWQNLRIFELGNDSLIIRKKISPNRNTYEEKLFLSSDYGNSWQQIDFNSISKYKSITGNKKKEKKIDLLKNYKKVEKIKQNQFIALDSNKNLFRIYNKNKRELISNKDHSFYGFLTDTNLYASYLFLSDASKLFKFQDSRIDSFLLFTSSERIAEPEDIYLNNKLKWGFVNNTLYFSNLDDSIWYRQEIFDFSINDLNFVGSDSIIITDYKYDNHIYSIKSKEIKKYNYESNSINEFFEYDITTIHVESGNSGCLSSANSEVKFELTNEDLVSETVYIEEHFKDPYTLSQLIKITPDTLKKAILNSFKNRGFSFDISSIKESSFKTYFVEYRKRLYEEPIIRNKYKTEDYTKETNDFIELLDTLSQETIDELVYEYVEPYHLLSMWFVATFENSNGDTLIVRTTNQSSKNPFNLPWIIKYDGLIEKTYNHELSEFFNYLVPKVFFSRSYGRKQAMIKIFNKLKVIREKSVDN